MVAFIRILEGSFPTQATLLSHDRLRVVLHDGGDRTYQPTRAIVAVRKISSDRTKVVFDVKFRDKAYFRGEASNKAFQEIEKCVEASTDLPFILEENAAPRVPQIITTGERLFQFIILGGVIFAMLFTIYGCSMNSDAPTHENRLSVQADIDDARIIVPVLCEQRAKDSLKAPRTAKFPWVRDVTYSGRIATMSSYVDAQNGFGALIRIYYICTVEYNGGKPRDFENWHIKEFLPIE